MCEECEVEDMVCSEKMKKNWDAEVSNFRFIGELSAEQLAEKFHTLYEGFAPEYCYKTRTESAVPWADVPEQNKKLMIRVCRTILGRP